MIIDIIIKFKIKAEDILETGENTLGYYVKSKDGFVYMVLNDIKNKTPYDYIGTLLYEDTYFKKGRW